MATRLILIRHAKSSWDQPDKDDHARVLNARGRSSAVAIGKWLAEKGYLPDLILCSDAARTAETCDLLCEAFAGQPKISYHHTLYHAAPDTILNLVGQQEVETVAVVGHNPGIGLLANAMAVTQPDHPRFVDYPTCATTILDLGKCLGSSAVIGSASVVDFIVPRDLS